MPHDPGPRRVAPIGARVPLAHAVTDVVDVSGTGVLIRVSDEWRPGSEWPLVLELPSAAPVLVTGRVVRCEPVAASRWGGAWKATICSRSRSSIRQQRRTRFWIRGAVPASSRLSVLADAVRAKGPCVYSDFCALVPTTVSPVGEPARLKRDPTPLLVR